MGDLNSAKPKVPPQLLHAFLMALLMVLVSLCFAPAVWGPFFFDDEHFILKNRFILKFLTDPQAVFSLYKTSVTDGAMIAGNFYRPHQQLVFALLARSVGLDPFWFHCVSIGIHSINCVLVLVWLRSCFGFSLGASFIGALFFGIHPVQTEAVCYISGLADPLGTFFWLSALLLLVRGLEGKGWERWVAWILGFCLMVQGFLTKESSIVAAGFLGLSLVGRRLRKKVKSPATSKLVRLAFSPSEVWILGGVGLSTGIYIVLRLFVLNFNDQGLGVQVPSNIYTQNFGIRLITFINVLWDYGELIFWPERLYYEKPYRAYDTLWSLRGFFGLGLVSAVFASLVKPSKHPALTLGLGCFFFGLVPYMGWVPLNAIFLEHWLYMPMIGLALILAGGVDSFLGIQSKRWVRMLTLLGGLTLTIAMALRTFKRSFDWANQEAFYTNEIAMSGGSTRMHNNLGMYYADTNRFDLALDQYQKAIDGPGAPLLPQPHHNRAQIYLGRGQWELGIQEIKLALQKDPRFIYSLRLLAQVWEILGQGDRLRATQQAVHAVESGQHYDVKDFFARAFP